MDQFTPPVSRLATHFVETWEFEPQGCSTKVVRLFELFARHGWSRPLLGLISLILKKAIARHMRQMRDAAARRQPN